MDARQTCTYRVFFFSTTGMYKGASRNTHVACMPFKLINFTIHQKPVAIGELRLTHFNQVDLDEIKHEINVLK